MSEMKWHEYACIFPMLPQPELQSLAEDIKKHGQREPVVLFDGKVLDGRNRWMACLYAGVEPKTIDFTGNMQDALDFVWSTNRMRRQLTSSQAAACLVEREKFDEQFAKAAEEIKAEAKKRPGTGRPKKGGNSSKKFYLSSGQDDSKRTDAKLASQLGTNHTYVNKARKVKDQAPDLHNRVKLGHMTVAQASTELSRRNKRRELEEKSAEVEQAAKESDQPSWLLLHNDVMDGLQSVVEHHAPARLIFTDPPYNIGIDYGDHHNDSMLPHEFTNWCGLWMELCVDCLADDGSMWVMINDEYAADFVKDLQASGLHLRAWIKWYESFGVNCSNNFNRTSRHILYCVKDPKNFVFNETEALVQSARQSKYKDSRAQSSGKIMDDVWQFPRLTGTSSERIPDVPTQLPLDLVSLIVRVSSEPGDLVVDPFNGSGTTGAACIRSNRKYIGIDASEAFIDIATKRLRAEQ